MDRGISLRQSRGETFKKVTSVVTFESVLMCSSDRSEGGKNISRGHLSVTRREGNFPGNQFGTLVFGGLEPES